MQDLPLFYTPDIEQRLALPEEEAGHALRVLRLSPGERVQLTDGKGKAWLAEISFTSRKDCEVALIESLPWQPYWQGNITLCVAPTKSIDRIEWLLEKAVEVGLNRVILLRCQHSERKQVKPERINKILIGAMKQSQKALRPELLVDVPFSEALQLTEGSRRLILHCRTAEGGILERHLPHEHYLGGDVSLFVGPEGDFTIEEILTAQSAGALPTSLGASRLRTETAALAALQWIHTLQMMKN
ncbi:MAG: RsmE family RNA methyltransferase [Porphyromonas sp.]|nr:RsmE family RNA methyltransferase [Porphyromonas sp.]